MCSSLSDELRTALSSGICYMAPKESKELNRPGLDYCQNNHREDTTSHQNNCDDRESPFGAGRKRQISLCFHGPCREFDASGG